MSLENIAQPGSRVVRLSDRIFDSAALLLLAVGVIFFAAGRSSLTRLASGDFQRQEGVSMVTIAERYDGQTRTGLWLIGAGLVAGVAAASRYRLRPRKYSK